MNWPRSKGRGHRLILLHLLISCFFIFAIMMAQYQVLAQSEEVHVFITGPDSVPTNTTAEYTIQITGGPPGEGKNWSFKAELDAGPVSPDEANVMPRNGSSYENIFMVNVTTPLSARSIYLIVNGSSSNITDTVWSGEVSKEIEVFEPIIVNISAFIRNSYQIDVKDALITFYVDGALIGNRTVDVPANGTEEVYLEWVASKTDEGEHEVEVRINEDGNLLEFDDGDNVMHKTIYIGERPEREMRPIMIFNNSGLVVVIEFLAIIFVIGAFMMRRNTLRGRGYYGTAASNVMYFEGILMIILSLPLFTVSQIVSENPDVFDDPNLSLLRLIDGILIFVLGFLTILLTWDRTRKKRR